MRVAELIEKLQALPTDWEIWATMKGSLEVRNPEGVEYGYVFTDGRPNHWLIDRRKERQLQQAQKEEA